MNTKPNLAEKIFGTEKRAQLTTTCIALIILSSILARVIWGQQKVWLYFEVVGFWWAVFLWLPRMFEITLSEMLKEEMPRFGLIVTPLALIGVIAYVT